GPIVPERDAEGTGEEDEAVGLIAMLVRTARHAGMREREIAHHRLESLRQIVIAVELDQPTAWVCKPFERLDKDARYRRSKRCCIHNSYLWQLCLWPSALKAPAYPRLRLAHCMGRAFNGSSPPPASPNSRGGEI